MQEVAWINYNTLRNSLVTWQRYVKAVCMPSIINIVVFWMQDMSEKKSPPQKVIHNFGLWRKKKIKES